jgi:hypothetical protein
VSVDALGLRERNHLSSSFFEKAERHLTPEPGAHPSLRDCPVWRRAWSSHFSKWATRRIGTGFGLHVVPSMTPGGNGQDLEVCQHLD